MWLINNINKFKIFFYSLTEIVFKEDSGLNSYIFQNFNTKNNLSIKLSIVFNHCTYIYLLQNFFKLGILYIKLILQLVILQKFKLWQFYSMIILVVVLFHRHHQSCKVFEQMYSNKSILVLISYLNTILNMYFLRKLFKYEFWIFFIRWKSTYFFLTRKIDKICDTTIYYFNL